MEKENFALLITKNMKKDMKKGLKKYNLKFLEALPVNRTVLRMIYGDSFQDFQDDDVDLKNLVLCMVEGTMEDFENYCKDPLLGIAQLTKMDYMNV